MKSKLTRILMLVAAAVLLVVVTVYTTVAFLASSSAVSNTFTVGNIKLGLFESKVDENGQALPYADGVRKDSDGNSYHLVPGKTYDKDPTVYVEAGSEKSLLFLKVRNQIETIEYGNYSATDAVEPNSEENKLTIREQMARKGWELVGSNETGEVYVYAGAVVQTDLTGDALAAIKDKNTFVNATVIPSSNTEQVYDVFETFTVDNTADDNLTIYGGAKVTVTAFSIQSTTFTNDATANRDQVIAAWNAIVDEFPFESGTITAATE